MLLKQYKYIIKSYCINLQDHQLRVPSVSISVYERGVRNCPWCAQLWQNYILTLERANQPYDKVKGIHWHVHSSHT